METFIFALGILALVAGLMTKRYLIGGLSGIVLLLYYFSLIENGNWLLMLLFATGVLLILAEIFLPTFGLLGIVGLALAGGGLMYGTGDLLTGLIDLSVGVIIGLTSFYILLKLGYRLPIVEKMVLNDAINVSGNALQKADLEQYIGQEGQTMTPLRPTGKAIFADNQVMEIVSDYEIINADERIVVTAVKNNQILVRRKQ
ncbi:NfeD family protein [Aerococcus kribbianus]|uniref:Nodulation efficiency protein D n=1 Tax=Aerococcus kribbianus TaxID=2999064 RepID=A0A9X3FNQ8_9LACT|nr:MULTISPECIES: NfeD family protein [unclassified Aerococcus]MCZ0717128.1 nodulation efficiency protein D [Aerococcus sp. YH-aer221]MCZ0725416.1 nodulation efficiency protein D [Aerococcus sp. YH-aer222]